MTNEGLVALAVAAGLVGATIVGKRMLDERQGSLVRVGPRLARSAERQQAEYDESPEGLAGRRIAIAHRLMQAVRRRVETVGRDERWGPSGYGSGLWRTLITARMIRDEDVPTLTLAVWFLDADRRRSSGALKRKLDRFRRSSPSAKRKFLADFAEVTLPNSLDTFERAVAVVLPDDGLSPIEDWVRSVEAADRAEGLAVP